MEISMKKEIKVNAKVLKLHLKVCDSFYAGLLDSDGEKLKDYDGYVPSFMPGEHYGDYVILDIDIDTGQILNWEKPSASDIEDFINSEEQS